MRKTLLSAVAAATIAVPAFAETTILSEPIAGTSLHTGALDMAAYRIDLEDGAYEVTAVFRDRVGGAPHHVVMHLNDHDEVNFSMPGELHTLYTFERIADIVEISAQGAPVEIASR